MTVLILKENKSRGLYQIKLENVRKYIDVLLDPLSFIIKVFNMEAFHRHLTKHEQHQYLKMISEATLKPINQYP